jgi:hypothetical protein
MVNTGRSFGCFLKLNWAIYRSRKFSEQAPLLERAAFRKAISAQHLIPQM